MQSADGGFVVHLVRIQDIPTLVGSGTVHAGVSGDEWIEETRADVTKLAQLGWYRARICLVVHPDHAAAHALHGGRIATEYPEIARRFLRQAGYDGSVMSIYGAAEAYLPDLADAVIDCVETGESIRRHGLRVEFDLLDCDVQIIASPGILKDDEFRADLGVFRTACVNADGH
jgi:ATP phosphoribosyltransferase